MDGKQSRIMYLLFLSHFLSNYVLDTIKYITEEKKSMHRS